MNLGNERVDILGSWEVFPYGSDPELLVTFYNLSPTQDIIRGRRV